MADVYQSEPNTFNWRRVTALAGAFTVHVFALALLATPAAPPQAQQKKVDNKVTVDQAATDSATGAAAARGRRGGLANVGCCPAAGTTGAASATGGHRADGKYQLP